MSSDRTVFVGGISWKANEENLKTFFSTFGTVTDCKIIVDKNSNKSKGYGFVTFEDPEIAEKVKKSKDLNFMGKTMNASDAYRKNDGAKKPASNIPGNNYDHPGYQSPPYSVPYAIPVPYYVPSYNPISYVPYVYPYYGGWSPTGANVPDYYLYQPYEYDEAYDEDDNGGDNGEGEIEGGKGSKESTSNGEEEEEEENTSNTANTADSQSNTELHAKVSDTPGGTFEKKEKSVSEDENSNHSNNQEVDG